ncbi:calsenilin-like isoform X2 [Mobula hypostoma]|uniref:calsenilin-like isoform X2 n=1 Tax=Mobula hypostoma TaxID=723540 RepID=UPI002FC357D4
MLRLLSGDWCEAELRTHRRVKGHPEGSHLGHSTTMEEPVLKKNPAAWQRPEVARKAVMECCLVKWILSRAIPHGTGFFVLHRTQSNNYFILLSICVLEMILSNL